MKNGHAPYLGEKLDCEAENIGACDGINDLNKDSWDALELDLKPYISKLAIDPLSNGVRDENGNYYTYGYFPPSWIANRCTDKESSCFNLSPGELNTQYSIYAEKWKLIRQAMFYT